MYGTWLFAFLALVAYLQLASSDPSITCKQHSECPEKMSCKSESSQCVDPCLAHKCGTDASCVFDDHLAKCRCNPGTLGDPNEECSSSTYAILAGGGVG